MDTVITLSQILRQEVSAYSGEWTGMDGKPTNFYYAESPDSQVFCILAPQTVWRKTAELIMMARIIDDHIIIDIDKSDSPLREALLRKGLSEEQVVCAR